MKIRSHDRNPRPPLPVGTACLGGLLLFFALSGCKPEAPRPRPKSPPSNQAQTGLPVVLAITNFPVESVPVAPIATTAPMATVVTSTAVSTAAPIAAIVNPGKDPFEEPKGVETPATNAPIAGLTANTNVTPDPFLDPTEFPALAVQGIFDRPTNSSVLINGRTLFVRDFFNDAKVVAITPRQVTLEYRGMEKTIEVGVDFPPLKLERVSAKPPASARINGQTVSVGDLVEGVKVLAIETNRVLVELSGVQKELEWRVEFPEMKLQGIVFRVARASALINGQSVTVGDMVGEVKVLEIQTNSVRLEYEGMVTTLELPTRP